MSWHLGLVLVSSFYRVIMYLIHPWENTAGQPPESSLDSFNLFVNMLFLHPRHHELPGIDEKTRSYQFEKHMVSEFIA